MLRIDVYTMSGQVIGLGERIRGRRNAQGMSLRDMAKVSHVSFSHLEDIELGRKTPSVPVLMRIAGVLGVKAAFLLGEQEVPEELSHLPADLREWVKRPENKDYLNMAKEFADQGLPTDALSHLVEFSRRFTRGEVKES